MDLAHIRFVVLAEELSNEAFIDTRRLIEAGQVSSL